MKRFVVIAIVSICSVAWAVSPATWSKTTEGHYANGEFDSTVVNSRGQVSLARKLDIVLTSDDAPAVVSAVAATKNRIFVASGSSNEILVITDGEKRLFARPPGTMIASLAVDGKDLLVGTGGKGAGLYRIESDGEIETIWTDETVKYVWAIELGKKGVTYVATGPEAKIFAIDKKGKGEILFEAGQLAKNILCLELSTGGLLYGGTDEDGLVVEIDLKRKSSRVILDADESEISVLLADGKGGLFVATADTAKASSEGQQAPAKDKTGRSPESQPAKPAPKPNKEFVQDDVEQDSAGNGAGDTAPAEPAKEIQGPQKPDAVKSPSADADEKLPAGSILILPTGDSDEVNVVVSISDDTAPDGDTSDEPDKEPGPSQFFEDGDKADIPEAIRRQMSRSVGRPSSSGPSKGKGNAVYYIKPQGLAKTIFRRPVTILAMVAYDGKLILGTGNGGDLFTVTTDGDLIARIANTDAKQVTALFAQADGDVLFGTSNKGSLGRISGKFAAKGDYICDPLDAKQLAQWGTVKLRANVPAGTTMTLSTRSGNLAEPDDATWSSWSSEAPLDGKFVKIAAPAARFLQFRLSLTSDGKVSPIAEDMELIYQMGNLAPQITAVTVKPSDKPAASGSRSSAAKPGGPQMYRLITIKASDPNSDKLTFRIDLKQVDTAAWVQLTKDLKAPKYIWDTRDVSDGTYELRITASDTAANPPSTTLEGARLSEPVVVDNTAPVIQDLKAEALNGKYRFTGLVVEKASRIVSMQYSVDSQQDWVAILPDDGIADSAAEEFTFELTDLGPGPHRIAVRVADVYKNTGYASLIVTVPKK